MHGRWPRMIRRPDISLIESFEELGQHAVNTCWKDRSYSSAPLYHLTHIVMLTILIAIKDCVEQQAKSPM